MGSPLKVGLAQIRILPGDKKANVAALLEAVARAARARCDVVVLPECPLAGWLSPAARFAAEPIPGPLTRRLAALARRHRLAIVAGLEEREGERLYNSAVFLDEEGRLLLRHRKIAELDIGLELYARGTSLAVVPWRDRTVGVDICADSWGPEIPDALYAMGARILFSPCAWAVRPGGEETNLAWIREAYRARTRGRDLTIAAANGVGPVTQGPWAGRILQGNSLVIGPDGRAILEGPTNEVALLTATI
ncbi:MAG TPA: carbon-nitrogen hydrolase family protein [Planctomycetota bacterium]|jgi:predicted amidohydrolase|nr:carbon-nitrogen hydrolase family protein [Planctomycetota bacterium]